MKSLAGAVIMAAGYPGLAWITPGESARLTAEYVATARELVRARMVIAGHRLAKVLNGALRAP